MPTFKWKGMYFYGYYWPNRREREAIMLETNDPNIGERYGMKRREVTKWTTRDPEGNPVLYYFKKIKEEELDDKETPRNYPGYYYWVWHNGVFFNVRGETERYVLVEVQEGNYRQADALGIPREKVKGKYYDGAEVGMGWIKKSEIKMPDEFGKGRYIYLNAGYYRDGVYEVVEREGNKIRVRGKKANKDDEYERVMDRISRNAFPWSYEYKKWNEGTPKVWIGGEWIYYEATFDLEKMKKIRREMDGVFDFYLYGEEEVPYRL